jgi:hypothetical protein
MGAPMKKLSDMSPDELRSLATRLKPDLDAALQQHLGQQAQAQVQAVGGAPTKQGIAWIGLTIEAVMAILSILKQHGIAVSQ